MHSSTGGSPERKGMCRPATICPRLVPTRNRGNMKPPRNPDSTVMLMAKSFVMAMIAYQPGSKIQYFRLRRCALQPAADGWQVGCGQL